MFWYSSQPCKHHLPISRMACSSEGPEPAFVSICFLHEREARVCRSSLCVYVCARQKAGICRHQCVHPGLPPQLSRVLCLLRVWCVLLGKEKPAASLHVHRILDFVWAETNAGRAGPACSHPSLEDGCQAERCEKASPPLRVCARRAGSASVCLHMVVIAFRV